MQELTRESARTLESEIAPDELCFLREVVVGNELSGTHVEIGTAAGGTLCAMMLSFEPRKCPKFVVVDTMTYFPDQLNLVRKNLKNHDIDPDNVDFRVAKSNEEYDRAQATGERFDFILVDASHKIRHVMADLRWLRLLNLGGLACFHDYSPKFKGVQWPVDRFLKRNPQFSRVGLMGSLLCIRRDTRSSRPEVTPLDRAWALLWSPILQLDLSLRKRIKAKRNSCPA